MTDRPTEDIVEIGARALFDAAGRVRYGRDAPDWNRHLTERNREQGRAEFREFLSELRAAGMVVVPMKPTEAMKRAGLRAWNNRIPTVHEGDPVCDCYRAMIRTARPAPPATGGEDG